jgi:uncharacterized protein with gpF-like domain
MASQPDNTSRNAALATGLALYLTGQRYDLPGMIRMAKARPRAFRRIDPTEAMRSGIAAPYFTLTRQWAAERDLIMRAYAIARDTGNSAILQRQIDQSAARLGQSLPGIQNQLAAALDRLEVWHRAQWNARIKTATGIDVSLLNSPAAAKPELANALTWNQQLATSLHQETGHKIAAALLGGLAAIKPASQAEADFNTVITKARKRAANIGVDQTDKTSAALDRARRAAAGLARFRWHHTPQQHPRDDHLARDGKVYREDRAPNDRAGVLPFCKCWEEPLFD